ncbi:MAG: transcription-repair coupling factor, partial [Bacteroidota bacterium]
MNILDELKRRYAGDEGVQQVIRAIARPGARVAMRGASGSALSFMASAVIRSVKQPVVMVLEDKERAAYALNDLEHLFGLAAKDDGPASMQGEDGVKLFFFPRSARVPYQVEQTENANVAMRAEVLNDLRRHKGHTVVVTYAEAIAENVVTESEMARNTYDIEVGHTLSLDFMDELFHDFGFEKVDYVYEPGQYAVRGGLIDIFSFSFDHPYRIELFGNEVESIRKFEQESQLSVAKMTKATIVPNVTAHHSEESRISILEFMPETTV